MNSKDRFNSQVADIVRRAQIMRKLCINSQFDENNAWIKNPVQRAMTINPCEIDAMFESVSEEHARQIVSACQSAVREYAQTYGCDPRDEVLASAHKTMETMLTLQGDKNSTSGMMLESIGKSLETSEGVDLRAKMIALVLPTLLAAATNDAVAFIPARNDKLEIFRMIRQAGTSFGDYARGDVIDDLTAGNQYSQMRQMYPMVEAQQPDGTKKQFVFTAKTDLKNTKIDIPMLKGSIGIYVNRKKVASDLETNGDGNLFGNDAGTTYTGSIDYNKGVITVNSSTAIPAGVEMHVKFDVDIEADPSLIPTVTHSLMSKVLTPSQNAIAAESTIQALFAMRREFNIDLKSTQMQTMRNMLAFEKSVRHLREIDFATTREVEFNTYCPEGYDWKLHREKLRETLLKVSQILLFNNKVSGLKGLFAGCNASVILKSLGEPHFTPAPNYVQTNQIHYAGMLFGMFKVFECPVVIDTDEMIGYARGQNFTEAGYIAGDAVAATMYDHEIGVTLRSRETLWELAFGEINPFNGQDYFIRIKMKNEAPARTPLICDCPADEEVVPPAETKTAKSSKTTA